MGFRHMLLVMSHEGHIKKGGDDSVNTELKQNLTISIVLLFGTLSDE